MTVKIAVWATAGLSAWLAQASALPAQEPEERLADTIARRSLEELGARPAEAERLLERNLSRYFVAYPLLAGAENRQAVLQATLRSTARFAGGVLMLAAGPSNGVDRSYSSLSEQDVVAAIDRVLPTRENPWRETVLFPEGASIPLETWDLKAMTATGIPWAALGFLVQQPIPQRLADATLSEGAVDRLAEASGVFALLLLRLAGEEARQNLDSYVQPRHLRAAVERIQRLRLVGEPVDLWNAVDVAPGSWFSDVTDRAGLRFRHVSSDWIARFRRWGEDAPTFSGGGVAARDLDGDSWPDLVFCGGAGCRLYRNQARQGAIEFEDVSEAVGLQVEPQGAASFEARMPLPADFDGDGDLDLFVTAAKDGSRLYRNDRSATGMRLVDVTKTSGLSRPGDIAGAAAAFDADGDGDLDLFVGNFGDYLQGASPWLSPDSRNAQPNRLFLNQGGLRFSEGAVAGVGDTGWAQAVSHFDFDGDGDQDLYVANDFGRNEVLRNDGQGRFATVGDKTGGDDPFHGMNAAFADLDRDRLPDVFITNIWTWNPADGSLGEANSLLVSQASAKGVAYRNESSAMGLTAADTGWAWGALFFDADHDGLDDLLVLSGLHDYNTFFQWRPHPGGDQLVPTTHRREPNVFYRGSRGEDGGYRFQVVEKSGSELPGVNSRALALADLDRDGDLDVAMSSFHDQARILRNDLQARPTSRWLQVELFGGKGGDDGPPVNPGAVGAVIVATSSAGDSDGLYVWRMATGGEGYLSVSQRPLHLGVGSAEEVELEVTWPGGTVQTYESVPTNRRIRLHYGRDTFETVDE
ncbi:MAG: CRTAC1 family protein [Thermoanaerobaculia bacterium]|nr:CRTAC1 family protein [Thermoanaerobaculia bacterium]